MGKGNGWEGGWEGIEVDSSCMWSYVGNEWYLMREVRNGSG